MISTHDVPLDEQVETAGSAPTADESPIADGTPQLLPTGDDGAPPPREPVELSSAAIDLALDAARSVAGDEAGGVESVGDYLGAHAEDDVAVTAGFRAKIRGYHGWQWSVTLASVVADSWTVSEVVLLPGDDALVAPPWVPWGRRVRGGDLGVGDLLPTPADDPRLVPGYLLSDDPAVEDVAREFGLGRPRVLSRDGRVDAAERWYEGSFGPSDPMAQQAPGRCGQCGFFVPLAGSLGGLFGACSNDMAPGDGRVVAVEYGCGAHSEAVAAILEPSGPGENEAILADGLRIDEERIDVHVRAQREETDDTAADPTGPAEVKGAPGDGAGDGTAGDGAADNGAVDDGAVDDITAGDAQSAAGPAEAVEQELTAEQIDAPESADGVAQEDPELVAAPDPGEDAALQAVLELLPPISGSADPGTPPTPTDSSDTLAAGSDSDGAGAGSDGDDTDAGVVAD